jgi:hypothetical protein
MTTKELTTNQVRTAGMLTAMFTENTGVHGMDSGGTYGRNWQRNQGLGVSDFLAMPTATYSRDYGVTVNSWAYCFNRLSYSPLAEVLTRLMNVWESVDTENRNPWDLGDQRDFVESLGGVVTGDGWNTYNFDNELSQILQGFEFDLHGQTLVLLQVHGGCDARGGYTRPVIFTPCCEYWLHGCQNAMLYCEKECEGWWGYSSGELSTWLGEYFPPREVEELLAKGCPTCGGEFTASLEECYN